MEHIIITIGRQLGSGGRVIAQKLAQEFDCQFYDKEILNLAAKESGFSEKIFEQNDEHKGFLKSLFHMRVPHVSDVNFYKSNISQEGLFQFQSDAIRKAAKKGSCVFVGRCADYILRDMPNVVNIFVTADIDWRAEQVIKRHQCTKEEALKIIHHAESSRASYYNYYTGKRWGDAASYDLCVDASILGIDATEQYIADFIRKRFQLQ
ncbi:MAG: cytidylate kinase-like family protein [Prevotella sp.]|nr:cytidylate kinase-like family protein [Prevotella sp.]MBR4368879.1 cytidylate kinase-like family protein [Prevotella sp.]